MGDYILEKKKKKKISMRIRIKLLAFVILNYGSNEKGEWLWKWKNYFFRNVFSLARRSICYLRKQVRTCFNKFNLGHMTKLLYSTWVTKLIILYMQFVGNEIFTRHPKKLLLIPHVHNGTMYKVQKLIRTSIKLSQ